jgi:hypothetical protein
MWLGMRLRVNWPWPPLKRGDGVTILIVTLLIIVIITVFFGSNKSAGLGPASNWGFGPDWRCTHLGEGDPVCFKKTPTKSPPPN